MRHEILGSIRAARKRVGLTQAELAARSGTGRVTIARIEAGSARDVRIGTIAALCTALGLEIATLPVTPAPSRETLVARERERGRRLDLRLRHARLAARLLGSRGREATALVARARAVVDRWEEQGLCSHHYISRWRSLLSGHVKGVAAALLDAGDWQDALFQNTPWAFALEPMAD